MFFDVSAMIDQLMGADELPKKIAFLLNTKYFLEQKIESGKYTTESLEYKNLQINSWAFINECEFFMKKSFSDQSLMGKYTARKSRHANRYKKEDHMCHLQMLFFLMLIAAMAVLALG
jgi:hypothetical protein